MLWYYNTNTGSSLNEVILLKKKSYSCLLCISDSLALLCYQQIDLELRNPTIITNLKAHMTPTIANFFMTSLWTSLNLLKWIQNEHFVNKYDKWVCLLANKINQRKVLYRKFLREVMGFVKNILTIFSSSNLLLALEAAILKAQRKSILSSG